MGVMKMCYPPQPRFEGKKDMKKPPSGMMCAGYAKAEDAPSSMRAFDDVLRDFALSIETAAEQGRYLHIYRKKTGEWLQTIPIGQYLGNHPYAGDFDFDGLEDFAISNSSGNCWVDCYLYDPEREQFRNAFGLSGHDFDLDPETKTVMNSGCGDATMRRCITRIYIAPKVFT